MTERLKVALQNLYETFSVYPLPTKMEGCPCCVTATDKAAIHLKKLEDLTSEDLSLYAGKAMTTWGDVEDFKYYLPRIFELIIQDDFYPDADIVLSKLEYGKWLEWRELEQEKIKEFLLEWWKDILSAKDRFDEDKFKVIANKLGTKVLLDNWNVDIDSSTFKVFISFIYEYVQGYEYRRGKEISKEALNEINKWLKEHGELLERAYYRYEKQEPEYAQTISHCYDIVHAIKE